MKTLSHFFLLSCLGLVAQSAAAPLRVATDFEGASARDVEVDDASRTIRLAPGGEPERGWPCWWYFRVDGVTPGETLTIKLRGSSATVANGNSPLRKPLSATWAMPAAATYSTDGRAWRQTAKGTRDNEWMVYQFQPNSESVFVAWGPPFTPTNAANLVRELSQKSRHATATELCKSRGGRPVPLLHVREGDRPAGERFGVWVQARQHACESGSSWVAQGFAEWLVSDREEAAWLRRQADVYVVPIMDIDNTATGNGGKDAIPQDHNRDWSEQPHWHETAAAQKRVGELIDAGRMDIFLDLHNPAPGDPTFFYILPNELMKDSAIPLRDRFIELAYGRISKIKPLIPMSNKPKVSGSNYHPLWRQISANWVAMNGNPHTVSLCLETIWNYQNCTPDGYRAVGANLAAATQEYLLARPPRETK